MNDIKTLNTNIHIRPELRGVICCKPKKKNRKKKLNSNVVSLKLKLKN